MIEREGLMAMGEQRDVSLDAADGVATAFLQPIDVMKQWGRVVFY
jgi:hypothetical protein